LNLEFSIILLSAWFLDLVFGDPAWLPHPVVWFGRMIAWCERLLNKGKHRKLKGALMTIFLDSILFFATWGLLRLAESSCIIHYALCTILVFYCLAGTTLIREVRAVFLALDRSLEEGRRQVARIVGRDTSELSAQEVRTAALETLAENLSDGVIAPLFWLAIGGVPAMLTYKMINTQDSMIGYRTERYIDYGCWAAHIDDIANYIPARITALLMMLAGWVCTKGKTSLLKLFPFVLKYGSKHASPNSGWPEAALAGILNCRFGGPHYYFGQLFPKPFIGENDRQLTTTDMHLSIVVCFTAEILFVSLIILISFYDNCFL
jgi:adenosylcobinamide-phosphate synthase